MQWCNTPEGQDKTTMSYVESETKESQRFLCNLHKFLMLITLAQLPTVINSATLQLAKEMYYKIKIYSVYLIKIKYTVCKQHTEHK